jgi:DNA-binding transcriptional MerR regulator
MSSKSPEAFRTISEVSKDLSLPQHVLRFWETKFVQIKPIKRGGGRRYYRPEDVKLLKGIKSLLYKDGYTIRGVQKVIKENGTKKLLTAQSEDKSFTEMKKNYNYSANEQKQPQYSIDETKRKKLMNVLEDLVQLRKKLDNK